MKWLDLHKKNPLRIAEIILLLAACYFSIFFHLDTLPVQMWDESRLAVNGIEMLKNGNWLVPHYGGAPEMWSVKPPLQIWLITISFKLFGVSELSLRLPSALAGISTVLLIYIFVRRHISKNGALLCALVLLTSGGYCGLHITRTGDYDALLVLWITTYVLSLFKYLMDDNPSNKWLVVAGFAVLLAFMTKGIASLFVFPGLLLFTLINGKGKRLFLNPVFYGMILIVISAILGYYLAREQVNPGYIQTVIHEEIVIRFKNVDGGENYHPSFFFYLEGMVFGFLDDTARFLPWIFVLPLAVYIGFQSKRKSVKQLILLLCILSINHLLVISSAAMKLAWYDAPMYPFMAMIVGLGLYELWKVLKTGNEVLKKTYTPIIVVLMVFVFPAWHIQHQNYLPKERFEEHNYGKMFDLIKEEERQVYAFHKEYNASLFFYQQRQKLLYNQNIVRAYSVYELPVGSVVVGCGEEERYALEHYGRAALVSQNKGCMICEIN